MAGKDPKEPEHEPESAELHELLAELQDEHTAQRRGPPEPGPAYRRPPHFESDLKRALYELRQDLLAPDPSAVPADATPPPPPAEPELPPPPAMDARDGRWEAHQQKLAWLAARVLIHQTPHSAAEQRALNIFHATITRLGGWLAAVQAHLAAQPPERIFAAWVQSLEGWSESEALNRLATRAAAQLVTLAPYVEAIVAAQRYVALRRTPSFVTVLQAAPVDAALVRLLTTLLHKLERRSDAEQQALAELAGRVARRRPEMAMALASAARALRALPYEQQPRHHDTAQALAVAVGVAGLRTLVPTATLGLTVGHPATARQWALALARCDSRECVRRLLDPAHGVIGHYFGLVRGIDLAAEVIAALPDDPATATLRRSVLLEHPDPYLRLEVAYKNPDARRRLVEICAILASLELAPGWVQLHPQRDRLLRFMQEKYAKADWNKLASRFGRPLTPLSAPLTPLQAATATHADLRHRALRNLAQQGHPEHLLAALLAADLDRALEAGGHWAIWRFVSWGRWLDLRLAAVKPKWSGASLTALLTVVRRLNQLGLLGTQHLSPALAELQRVGATAYATRYPPPGRLAPNEQAALEVVEAAFIASAPELLN